MMWRHLTGLFDTDVLERKTKQKQNLYGSQSWQQIDKNKGVSKVISSALSSLDKGNDKKSYWNAWTYVDGQPIEMECCSTQVLKERKSLSIFFFSFVFNDNPFCLI